VTAEFAYIGEGLTLAAFQSYVAQYDFGSIPPDYVVVHSTQIPSATWALYPSGDVWDAGEQGMTREEQYQHRKAKLDGIMRFYRDTNGWNAGPHLFIDDIWIWLFTPMYDIGIHAADGNSCHDAQGNLHYSIGVEVVGYYESVQWPAKVAANVAGAIQALHDRLHTFQYAHVVGPGGISRHGDWNKPECPGTAISMNYILKTVTPMQDTGRYIVKAGTIGATVVTSPQAVRQMIAPGAWWDAPTVKGPLMALAGYGTSDEYVGDSAHGFIWKPLLANRP
jgi:N-acetylmuramoyl-L-alanine amidase